MRNLLSENRRRGNTEPRLVRRAGIRCRTTVAPRALESAQNPSQKGTNKTTTSKDDSQMETEPGKHKAYCLHRGIGVNRSSGLTNIRRSFVVFHEKFSSNSVIAFQLLLNKGPAAGEEGRVPPKVSPLSVIKAAHWGRWY